MRVIRRGTAADVDAVAAIYEHIHDEEEAGRAVIGWARGVYPTRQTAGSAVERGDLFVAEEAGTVAAAAVINQLQVPEYALCPWEHPAEDGEIMVLHTLVVDPAAEGRGIGRGFEAFYERYAREAGCTCLRMDTNEKNLRARRLYACLGFKEPGVVLCTFNGIPGVRLVCLEKKLE